MSRGPAPELPLELRILIRDADELGYRSHNYWQYHRLGADDTVLAFYRRDYLESLDRLHESIRAYSKVVGLDHASDDR